MATLNANLDLFLGGLLRHGTPYISSYDGRVHLSLPERLPFTQRDDTKTHICKGHENCYDLAVSYYPRVADPAERAEIIAQFQEDPILDLTVPLPQGRLVLIPSESYIQFIAFGDSLTEYPEF